MDKELEQALSNSNYRITFENQKEKLQECLQADLLFSYNGGFFKLGPKFFMDVKFFLEEDIETFTILDKFMSPIDITNGNEFYKNARSLYTQAINKYRVELAKLMHRRDTKNLVEVFLEDDVEE